MIDFNDETGSAVGFYLIIMGSAFLVATIITSIFFEISFSTPLFLLIVGFCIVMIFGGFKKKRKSDYQIKKPINSKDKLEIEKNKSKSQTSKEIEADLLKKEIMKILEIDEYK